LAEYSGKTLTKSDYAAIVSGRTDLREMAFDYLEEAFNGNDGSPEALTRLATA